MPQLVTVSSLGNRGRLGNQLFQIAATLAYAERTGRQAVFKDWYCDRDRIRFADYFKNALTYSPSIRINSLYEEPHYHYTEIPNHFGNVDLHGYFQSERYFEQYADLVRHHFTPSIGLVQSITGRWHNVKWQGTASIHVRRGDYINTPTLYPLCSSDYYRAAIELMKGEYGVRQFLVFGDDIWWMKQQFRGSEFLFSYKNSSISDLFAMSMCAHNIIANSSFSWWASYFNTNPEKVVIAPKQWIWGEKQDDVYRKDWIVI